jgi:hypothetical protein
VLTDGPGCGNTPPPWVPGRGDSANEVAPGRVSQVVRSRFRGETLGGLHQVFAQAGWVLAGATLKERFLRCCRVRVAGVEGHGCAGRAMWSATGNHAGERVHGSGGAEWFSVGGADQARACQMSSAVWHGRTGREPRVQITARATPSGQLKSATYSRTSGGSSAASVGACRAGRRRVVCRPPGDRYEEQTQ